MSLFDAWKKQPKDGYEGNLAALTHRRLDEFWATVGVSEPDLLAYMVSPTLMGRPPWPSTRQAHRVVRRAASIVLATDGMSDPFDGSDSTGTGNGFGMELFLETADITAELAGTLGDISRIPNSWAFTLIQHVGRDVAATGGIVAPLERLGALSMELPGVSKSATLSSQLPDTFVTEDDCVGILLGAPEPDFPDLIFDMPLSSVRLVPIFVLTARELEFVRRGGAGARKDLVTSFSALPSGHRIDLNRASLV